MAVHVDDFEKLAERMRTAGVASLDIDGAGTVRRIELCVGAPVSKPQASVSAEPPPTLEQLADAQAKWEHDMLFGASGGGVQ